MRQEYEVSISFDLKIRPLRPYSSISEQLKINHAEVYMTANIYPLIKAIERKLTEEFNPNNVYDYSIKPIEIKT